MLATGPVPPAVAGTQVDIVGPAGSGAFGTSVTVLPNGNIVVTDPYHDLGPTADVGAVYLYDGATGAQISMLTGTSWGDQIGYSPSAGIDVTILSHGNFALRSASWDNGAATDAGAPTRGLQRCDGSAKRK